MFFSSIKMFPLQSNSEPKAFTQQQQSILINYLGVNIRNGNLKYTRLLDEEVIQIISGTKEVDSFTSWKRSQRWVKGSSNRKKKKLT